MKGLVASDEISVARAVLQHLLLSGCRQAIKLLHRASQLATLDLLRKPDAADASPTRQLLERMSLDGLRAGLTALHFVQIKLYRAFRLAHEAALYWLLGRR